ncbi:hypothetical protein QAD02_013435 [Eretmocerus hayati]|uniref:Uncharacterized protein n=1 Tax=Eretmocerus hayati TaxID=131215 RepID=A0ACC2P2E4_9HYME|nr:hypothetical protein QAD02_013435 [Eretmocerus hayati]
MSVNIKVLLWLSGAPGGWCPETRARSPSTDSMRPLSRASIDESDWTRSSGASTWDEDSDQGPTNTPRPSSPHSPWLREGYLQQGKETSSPLTTIRIQYASSDEEGEVETAAMEIAAMKISHSNREEEEEPRAAAGKATTKEDGGRPNQGNLAVARREEDARATSSALRAPPTIRRRSRQERAARNARWARSVSERAPARTQPSCRSDPIDRAPKFCTPIFFVSTPTASEMAKRVISFDQAVLNYRENENSDTENDLLEAVRRNRRRRQTRLRVQRFRRRRDHQAYLAQRRRARQQDRYVEELDRMVQRILEPVPAAPRRRRQRQGPGGPPHEFNIVVPEVVPQRRFEQPGWDVEEAMQEVVMEAPVIPVNVLQPPAIAPGSAEQQPRGVVLAQAEPTDRAVSNEDRGVASNQDNAWENANDAEFSPADFAMWVRPSATFTAVASPADSSSSVSRPATPGGMYLINPERILQVAEQEVDMYGMMQNPPRIHGAPYAAPAAESPQQNGAAESATTSGDAIFDAEFMSEFLHGPINELH